MLGSEILEIAIGVVFTFLLLSLTASTIRETAEGFLKTRAVQLERGLREMMDDPTGLGITKQLFDHPLLYSLYTGNYEPEVQLRKFIIPRKTLVVADDRRTTEDKQQRLEFGSNLPSYIPARNFAMALLDLAATQNGGAALNLDAARETAVTLRNGRLRDALLVAIGEAEGDLDRARTSLEAWFDGTMDRVSGWYKRETQWILLGIGLVLAMGLNVDSLHVARSLALNNTLRQKIVQTVESQRSNLDPNADAATDAGPAKSTAVIPQQEVDAQLSGLTDIIGWPQFEKSVDAAVAAGQGSPRFSSASMAPVVPQTNPADPGARAKVWWEYLALAIPGWLISALAVSLGAPFWFDILNKLMVVRSTVKPYQKSPSEGSDDRRPGKNAADLLAPRAVTKTDADANDDDATKPMPEAITVAIRLAIDAASALAGPAEVVVDGQPQAGSADNLFELHLQPNVNHTITATAKLDDRILTWTKSISPGLDDEGWPMLAFLE